MPGPGLYPSYGLGVMGYRLSFPIPLSPRCTANEEGDSRRRAFESSYLDFIRYQQLDNAAVLDYLDSASSPDRRLTSITYHASCFST